MMLLPLLLAWAGSLAIETAGSPRPIGRRPADLAIRLGGYALLTAFWFQFSWRPWLAAFSCLLTVAIFEAVSRLKRRVIGEPLVFSDFALLAQVPRFPDLYYVPPFTDPRMAGPIGLGIAGIAAWYAIEPAWLPAGAPAAVAAFCALPAALLSVWSAARVEPLRGLVRTRWPRPNLDADVARYGQPATLLAYLLRRFDERRTASPPPAIPARHAGGDEVVVVVQLESFVDPARLGGPDLPLMDRIRTEAVQYGRLRVPAHGAYTMRTEHAVLTGRSANSLGFGAFDPYLSGGGREPTSLARIARDAGYETVFVHPFDPTFFDRTAVFAKLGFDRLVTEDAFPDASRVGPYVGDEAVAARILEEVRSSSGPILVFCVTMENHGPWKPGRLPGIDDPLAQYLHHVAGTGRAVEALIDGLAGRRATLCVFGDHAPSLPTCRPGFGGTRTDYAIFRFGPNEPSPPRRVDLAAHELGCLLRGALAPEMTVPHDASVTVPPS